MINRLAKRPDFPMHLQVFTHLLSAKGRQNAEDNDPDLAEKKRQLCGGVGSLTVTATP